MKKLLFIGRSFHKESKSADFFIKKLESQFDLHLWYPEDHLITLNAVIDSINFETTIVCWQSEHLSYYFSVNGYKVLNISMYDGIEARSDHFYHLLSGCKHLNFSMMLHEKMCKMGLDSEYIQYFPKNHSRTSNDRSGVFFWERNPDFLSAVQVYRIFSYLGVRFVFHRISSKSKHELTSIINKKNPIVFNDSKIDQEDFNNLMISCKYFVLSRPTEGIGMSFLDAMSFGLVPIGLNKPTYNEYVTNGYNGYIYNDSVEQILIDPDHFVRLSNNIGDYLNSNLMQFINNLSLFVSSLNLKSVTPLSCLNKNLITLISEKYSETDFCLDLMDKILHL